MQQSIWKHPLAILLAAVLALGLYMPVNAATITIKKTDSIGLSSTVTDDYIVEDGGELYVLYSGDLGGTVTMKGSGRVSNLGTIRGLVTMEAGCENNGDFHNSNTMGDAAIHGGSFLTEPLASAGNLTMTGGHATVGGVVGDMHISGGYMVMLGGSAGSLTMDGGELFVYSGNTLGDAVVNGGLVTLVGTAGPLTLNGGRFLLESSGVINGDVIIKRGAQFRNMGTVTGNIYDENDTADTLYINVGKKDYISFQNYGRTLLVDGLPPQEINGRQIVFQNLSPDGAATINFDRIHLRRGIVIEKGVFASTGMFTGIACPTTIGEQATLLVGNHLVMQDRMQVNGTLDIDYSLLVSGIVTFGPTGSLAFSEYGFLELTNQAMMTISKTSTEMQQLINDEFIFFDDPDGGYAILHLTDGTFHLGADGKLVKQYPSSGSRSRSSSSSSSGSASAVTKRQAEIELLDNYAFRVDLPLLGFVSATVDNEPLEQGTHYSLREGSTVLTLSDEFVDGLKTGTHTLRMEFVGAVGKTEFTVDSRSGSDGRSGGDTFPSNANANPGTGR